MLVLLNDAAVRSENDISATSGPVSNSELVVEVLTALNRHKLGVPREIAQQLMDACDEDDLKVRYTYLLMTNKLCN